MTEKVIIIGMGLILFGLYLLMIQHEFFSKTVLGYIGLFFTIVGCINIAELLYNLIVFVIK